MKFITQENDYTCGPVAIYNAMIALGLEPPKLTKLIKMCCCTKKKGTYTTDLISVIKDLDLKVKARSYIPDKGVYIVRYKCYWGTYHFITKTDYGFHNLYKNGKYCKISEELDNKFFVSEIIEVKLPVESK